MGTDKGIQKGLYLEDVIGGVNATFTTETMFVL
jgi:hypothetical protein